MGLCCSSSKRSAEQQHQRDKQHGKASSSSHDASTFCSPNTKATSLMVADSPQPGDSNEQSETQHPSDTESTEEESSPTTAATKIAETAPPRPPKMSAAASKKRKPKRKGKQKKKQQNSDGEKSQGSERILIHADKTGGTEMLSSFRNFKQQAETGSSQQQKSKRKHQRKKSVSKDEKRTSALWSDFESIQRKVQYEMKTNDRASSTSKRSRHSKPNKTGKPPLTPNKAPESFDLKGTESWYVDFKSPDAASVCRSQANLSLLSENSLEIQRRLYAEKRQGRGGKGPSSPARSAAGHGGGSSLMELVQHHQTASSVAASADYGPVRRHRGGSAVVQAHDDGDAVIVAPRTIDLDDAASVVSDLAEDEDMDDDLMLENATEDAPVLVATTPYDHEAIVQQRLDIEEQLRQLREPTEDEFDEQPLVPIKLDTMTGVATDVDEALHNSGVTSISLFSGEVEDSGSTTDATTPPEIMLDTIEPSRKAPALSPPKLRNDRRGTRVRELTAKFSRMNTTKKGEDAQPPQFNVAASNARLQQQQEPSPSFDDESTENTEPVLHHRVIMLEPTKAQETLLLAGRVEEHVQTVLDRYRTNSD